MNTFSVSWLDSDLVGAGCTLRCQGLPTYRLKIIDVCEYLEALLDAVQTTDILPMDIGHLNRHLPQGAWAYSASCSFKIPFLDDQP